MWVMATDTYRILLRYVLPNLRLLQAPGPNYRMKEMIRKEMQEGDFLLSKSRYNITNWIIGGDFSHASVVVKDPDSGKLMIAEMTANDFDLVTVDHFCQFSTRIALLRLKDRKLGYPAKVAEKALSFQDCQYDCNFKLGVEALYCSELAYQSDYERRMQADLTDLVGLERPYISPDGIYKAKGLLNKFEWQDHGW